MDLRVALMTIDDLEVWSWYGTSDGMKTALGRYNTFHRTYYLLY